MTELNVDYVLVIFGGVIGYSGDDINKFLWMVRIAEGEHPNDIRSDNRQEMMTLRSVQETNLQKMMTLRSVQEINLQKMTLRSVKEINLQEMTFRSVQEINLQKMTSSCRKN